MDSKNVPRLHHPTYVREQNRVASLMIALLVRRGVSPEDALRTAEDMITPRFGPSEDGGPAKKEVA